MTTLRVKMWKNGRHRAVLRGIVGQAGANRIAFADVAKFVADVIHRTPVAVLGRGAAERFNEFGRYGEVGLSSSKCFAI